MAIRHTRFGPRIRSAGRRLMSISAATFSDSSAAAAAPMMARWRWLSSDHLTATAGLPDESPTPPAGGQSLHATERLRGRYSPLTGYRRPGTATQPDTRPRPPRPLNDFA